tara:strand:- start:1610 stop:1945 length:336 start_codon:yes stop_codon:yes gene_type:complete
MMVCGLPFPLVIVKNMLLFTKEPKLQLSIHTIKQLTSLTTNSKQRNANQGVLMSGKSEKRRDALGLFYESVLKPDHQLRQCAHNQECYNELMEWRTEIIEYLDTKRNQEFG